MPTTSNLKEEKPLSSPHLSDKFLKEHDVGKIVNGDDVKAVEDEVPDSDCADEVPDSGWESDYDWNKESKKYVKSLILDKRKKKNFLQK
jgi:hypothetical protein